MGSVNNRRIANNTMLLYVRTLSSMIVSLYTSRVILNVLGVEDFGIYNIVGGVVSAMAFFNAAMSTSTQRFLTYELGKGNFERLRKVFTATLLIHVVIAFVVLLLAETVGLWFLYHYINIPAPRFNAALWVYHFSVLTFFVGIIQVPYNASIIANEKMSVYAYMSIIEVVLKLVLVFSLTWIAFDKLKLYSMLTFSLAVIIATIYRIYCKKNFKECSFLFHKDKKLYKVLISYSGWNIFGNIASVAKGQGVNILLNIFFGPIVNAAQGIAYQVQGAIQAFVMNFQMAVNPQIIKSYANEDRTNMMSLIFKSSRFSFYLLFLLSLPILIETKFVLTFWLKLVPQYAALFTFLVIINALVECISGPLMTAAQATGKIIGYQVIVGLTLLLNLPIAYVFLKLNYPPQTTLFISIALSSLALLLRLLVLKRLIDLSIADFMKEVVGRSLLVAGIASIFPLYISLQIEEGLMRFLIVGISCVISSIVSIYLIGINRIEKEFIADKISFYLVKFKNNNNKQ